MEKVQAFLRRSEELVTKCVSSFRRDHYVRTELIIIFALFFLCFTNIALVSYSIQHVQLESVSIMVSSVSESIMNSPEFDPAAVTTFLEERLREIEERNLTTMTTISALITLIFGYVVAKLALLPKKNALNAEKQFIGNVAHELRTPLSILRANSEILLLDAKDDDTKAILEGNVEELDRISGIISNLLTLNTFRHIDRMHLESVDMSEIIYETVRRLEDFTASKSITVDVSDVNPALYLWANKSAIEQIAMNLIKNAIVYTGTSGTVAIIARRASNFYIEMEVRDTGIGMTKEQLEQIFEPFYQAEPSRSRGKGSQGLGLTFVSELVKLHHGKISVQSSPRTGTIVRVEFPAEYRKSLDFDNTRITTREATQSEIIMDFSPRK